MTSPHQPHAPTHGAEPSLALLERLGGDVQVLREVIDLFLGDTPRLLETLDASLSKGDTRTAYRTAHTLKGSAANFDADAVTQLAYRLELSARAGDLDSATSTFTDLDTAVRQLLAELRAIQESPCAS